MADDSVLATGSIPARDVEEGDHAAGFAAALADALRRVDENELSDPDQTWEVGFALQLEPGGSAKVTAYRAYIRPPVADIDW